jgi:hypothetical protein
MRREHKKEEKISFQEENQPHEVFIIQHPIMSIKLSKNAKCPGHPKVATHKFTAKIFTHLVVCLPAVINCSVPLPDPVISSKRH